MILRLLINLRLSLCDRCLSSGSGNDNSTRHFCSQRNQEFLIVSFMHERRSEH